MKKGEVRPGEGPFGCAVLALAILSLPIGLVTGFGLWLFG